jgi:hypothetical protein
MDGRLSLTPKLVSWNAFNGPGAFCMEHREFRLEPPIRLSTSSKENLQGLLEGLIREKGFAAKAFRWYPGQFGPIILDRLSSDDFKEFKAVDLPACIDAMVTEASKAFLPSFEHSTGEPEAVRQKMFSLLSILPVEGSWLWRYRIPIVKSNPEGGKLMDPSLFDFFHLVVGLNRTSAFTLCLFYD